MRSTMCTIAALSLVSSLVFVSCLSSPSREAEAEAEAEKVWKTLISKCGDSYYMSGVFHDTAIVFEMKNVTYRLRADQISDADRANGLQGKVHATADCKMHRRYDTESRRWTEWIQVGPVMPFFGLIKRDGVWNFSYRQNDPTAVDCSKIPR